MMEIVAACEPCKRRPVGKFMPNRDAFPPIFQRLKGVFPPFVPRLRLRADGAENFSLDAYPSAAYPKGVLFGAVQIKRNYVSYHLMPVYVFPDLLDDISARLRQRMQGKSCFNFTVPDESLMTVPVGQLTCV
jgi:hypothetical protein